MPQINRYTGNVRAFGIDATLLDRTVFGGLANSDVINDNVTTQYEDGWGSVTSAIDFPTIQDMNAAFFTAGQFLSYLHQAGIPDWDSLQEYYVNSYAKGSNGSVYRSKTGVPLTPNVGNDPTLDPVNWETISATDHANKVFSSNGYQVFPGGLILQWINIPFAAPIAFGSIIALPITFPNAFFGAVMTENSNVCQPAGIVPVGTANIQVWMRQLNGMVGTVAGQILIWGH